MSIHYAGPFPVTVRGEPAQMHVLRNDGFCWGRLVYADGREFDVDTVTDYYDADEAVAVAGFEHAARRGRLCDPVSRLVGWVPPL